MVKPVRPPAGVTHSINHHLIPANTALYRIHQARFGADAFNPGFGDARFSPFKGPDGAFVPSIYAADSLRGAMMESIFHDVSQDPAAKTYQQDRLNDQVMSRLVTSVDLQLVDLSNTSLIKLGMVRSQLIDTAAAHYKKTREWAKVLHEQNPDIAGLSWISRQDDTSRAYIFFGDRVPRGAFTVQTASQPLVSRGVAIMPVYELAIHLGVDIVI